MYGILDLKLSLKRTWNPLNPPPDETVILFRRVCIQAVDVTSSSKYYFTSRGEYKNEAPPRDLDGVLQSTIRRSSEIFNMEDN